MKKKKIIRFKSGKNVAGETFRYENKQGREVFFERFDDLYNFENSISYIKIDVEGNELDVLRSMKKNLENNSPIISLEFDMKDFTNICKTHGEWNRSKQQHEADLTFLRGSGCWDCGRIEIISFLRELGYKKFYFFKTNKPLGTRVRDIFVNFFRIIFMGYTNEIELMDSDFFDNNKFYIKDHIIISKQEIKNIF